MIVSPAAQSKCGPVAEEAPRALFSAILDSFFSIRQMGLSHGCDGFITTPIIAVRYALGDMENLQAAPAELARTSRVRADEPRSDRVADEPCRWDPSLGHGRTSLMISTCAGGDVGKAPPIVACRMADREAGEVVAYAEHVAQHLGVPLAWVPGGSPHAKMTTEDASQVDLLITGGLTRGEGTLRASSASLCAADEGAPGAILFVRHQRWPLKRILLVVKGQPGDERAAEWSIRLARPSSANITALAVVVPVPAMYAGLSRLDAGLRGVLAADTKLGRSMRRVAHRLVDGNTEGVLRLREGHHGWETRREAVEGQFDLIVMPSACRGRLRVRVLDDPVLSPAWAIDRPILLVR